MNEMSLNLIPPTSAVRAKVIQPGSLHSDRHRFPRETTLIFGQDMTFALSLRLSSVDALRFLM